MKAMIRFVKNDPLFGSDTFYIYIDKRFAFSGVCLEGDGF